MGASTNKVNLSSFSKAIHLHHHSHNFLSNNFSKYLNNNSSKPPNNNFSSMCLNNNFNRVLPLHSMVNSNQPDMLHMLHINKEDRKKFYIKTCSMKKST